MNKPYFTKYIPLEGEIKAGDRYRINTPDEVRYEIADKDHGAPKLYRDYDITKVKLFLCSRDIQVGDVVFNRYYYPFPNGLKILTNSDVINANLMSGGEPDDSTMHEYPHGEWEYTHQTYKVIGEVSPNAIWIKEGMEFEEDDISKCMLSELGSVVTGDIDGMENHETGFFRIGYQFKCPICSTFH